jgi:hypothetical protein
LDINVFTHAVVGIFVELSVLDNSDVIFGFIKKVVGVFIVKIDEAFPEPRASDPVVKLEPIVMADVSLVACISFVFKCATVVFPYK